MHKEILTKEQLEMLPLLKSFKEKFGLVGGTAIALHIGHRRSIDFDFFSAKKFRNSDIHGIILRNRNVEKIFMNRPGEEYTIKTDGIKMTFFHFPYKIPFPEKLDHFVRMPNLLTLAAMKAFALGQRAKWKDYVDLYFIIRDHYSISEISKRAEQLFGGGFNEKLLRGQFSYYEDVDYREEVEYLKGFEVSDAVVKRELKKFSLS